MSGHSKYNINLNTAFNFLELIDVPSLIAKCEQKWFNQTLCQVNDCVIRLGIFKEGEFHWHKHDLEDEFFFVLQGELIIELENESIKLNPHQGYTIPKGVVHKPSVQQPTAVLMVEGATVKPTGD